MPWLFSKACWMKWKNSDKPTINKKGTNPSHRIVPFFVHKCSFAYLHLIVLISIQHKCYTDEASYVQL